MSIAGVAVGRDEVEMPEPRGASNDNTVGCKRHNQAEHQK
jgi:hypothetical protein